MLERYSLSARRRAGLMLAAIALLCACQSAPQFAAKAPLPILAWVGPPAEETTAGRYREMADAGFNFSFTGQPSLEALRRQLDVGAEAGVKIMASCPQMKDDPEATIGAIKGHPALGGYFLRDEPGAEDFDELAAWTKRIQAADATHPCYINLFPTYANAKQLGVASYREHLDQFLAKVPVPILSFDHYPVLDSGMRPDWAENLSLIADAAKRKGIPFWAFTLSVALGPYPVATVESLRMQTFTDLAYGAQAIQYFTYWTPKSSGEGLRSAPIESDGARSVVYERAKQVNRELRAAWPLFDGARVERLGFAGSENPAGAKPFEPAPRVAIDGKRALVSLLASANCEILAVVNWDLAKATELSIDFDPKARVYEWGDTGILARLESAQFKGSLEPGGAKIFAWRARR